MSNGAVDPNWPRLMALSVHELRTPLSVVLGYLRMLDRAGALNPQQRSLVEHVSKSCGRLGEVISEMSDLSQIEEGKAKFNRSRVDVRALLAQAVSAMPELPDRTIRVTLATGEGPAMLEGDAGRLKTAFASLFQGLRRELVTSNELQIHEQIRRADRNTVSWIVFGPSDLVSALESATPSDLTPFNEWRGGCGLSLAVARRVIEAHRGRVWERVQEPAENAEAGEPPAAIADSERDIAAATLKVKKTAAVIMLPVA